MDLSVIEQFEQTHQFTERQLGYHKLAEAIRAGAKIRPQCTRGYYFYNEESCAIGAAFEGTFGRSLLKYEGINTYIIRAMRAVGYPTDVFNRIYAHNDSGWTRERIADHLDDVAYGRISEF